MSFDFAIRTDEIRVTKRQFTVPVESSSGGELHIVSVTVKASKDRLESSIRDIKSKMDLPLWQKPLAMAGLVLETSRQLSVGSPFVTLSDIIPWLGLQGVGKDFHYGPSKDCFLREVKWFPFILFATELICIELGYPLANLPR